MSERQEIKTKPTSAINIKILLHMSPGAKRPYYTIAVGKIHKVGYFETKRILANQTGRGFIPNLLELLTQDSVLEAIAPNLMKVVSQ